MKQQLSGMVSVCYLHTRSVHAFNGRSIFRWGLLQPYVFEIRNKHLPNPSQTPCLLARLWQC